jgi:hypothetical protein
MILVFGTSASVACAADQQYSADMVMSSGGQTVSGKVYASGQLLRYEMGPTISITRLDRKKAYVLMPEQMMYMEQPIDPMAGMKAGVGQAEGTMERTSMGTEDIGGRSAEKFKVIYTSPEGETITLYQWIEASGLQLKAEAEDGSWSVSYTHVVTGPQPAELFEVPSNYQLFTMPDVTKMMQMNPEDLQNLAQSSK